VPKGQEGEAMTECQSDRPEQGGKSNRQGNDTAAQSASGEISGPALVAVQDSQAAQLHGANVVSPVRKAFSYFAVPAMFWLALLAPLVIASVVWLSVSKPRHDPGPEQVAPPAGSPGQSQPQKGDETRKRSQPDRMLKDIAATWPLPLATRGFDSLAQHPLRTQRSVPIAAIRQARTHRSNQIALELTPQHANDQRLTSYSRAAPIRYPCLSPFIGIMTPLELVVCGVAPLMLSPIAFPPQPAPVFQAPPRPEQVSSDRSIY
jgi:hypothetical protein